MSMFEFEVDTRAPVSMLAGIGRRSADMRPAMRIIRELLVEGHRRNFATHGSFLDAPWPALSESTRARKAREGIPAEPLVGSLGALRDALSGGRGKRARATRTSASAGVTKTAYLARIHQGGAEGGRRGKLPARRLVGIAPETAIAAETIIERYLVHGSL